MSLVGAQCTCDEKAKSISHRMGAPCPVHGTTGKALSEHVTTLEAAVVKLQERVAHAELARDNAIAQRDAVQERAKQKAKSAGDRISALVALMRVCAETPLKVNAVERYLEKILGADGLAERNANIEEMAASMSEAEVAALPIRDEPKKCGRHCAKASCDEPCVLPVDHEGYCQCRDSGDTEVAVPKVYPSVNQARCLAQMDSPKSAATGMHEHCQLVLNHAGPCSYERPSFSEVSMRHTHPCSQCGAPYYDDDGEPAFDDHPGAR